MTDENELNKPQPIKKGRKVKPCRFCGGMERLNGYCVNSECYTKRQQENRKQKIYKQSEKDLWESSQKKDNPISREHFDIWYKAFIVKEQFYTSPEPCPVCGGTEFRMWNRGCIKTCFAWKWTTIKAAERRLEKQNALQNKEQI